MSKALDTRDPLMRATSRSSRQREREQFCHFFRKIQEAAADGQNGSERYARDRLAFIQALATTVIAKFEA